MLCSARVYSSAFVSDDKRLNQSEFVYRGKDPFSKPILILDDVSKNISCSVNVLLEITLSIANTDCSMSDPDLLRLVAIL